MATFGFTNPLKVEKSREKRRPSSAFELSARSLEEDRWLPREAEEEEEDDDEDEDDDDDLFERLEAPNNIEEGRVGEAIDAAAIPENLFADFLSRAN